MKHKKTREITGTRTEVRGDSDEAFRRALKQFSRKVADADILGETRRREHFEKPTARRRRLKNQARRRHLKNLQREQLQRAQHRQR